MQNDLIKMVLTILFSAATIAFLNPENVAAAEESADEWLNRLDHNVSYMTAVYTASMLVHHPGGKEREFRFRSKVSGRENALMEFISPARDKGVRYLKRKKNLWIYFPKQQRTMHIQGHMLREGVQGGDMSYEDLTESSDLRKQYTAWISGETDSTVIIELTAKDMTVSYPFREIVISRKTAIPVLIRNYGIGRTPIKEIATIKSLQFGNRYFPVVMEIRNLLVEDKWTRLTFENIEFGMEFPEYQFSREALEKR